MLSVTDSTPKEPFPRSEVTLALYLDILDADRLANHTNPDAVRSKKQKNAPTWAETEHPS